MQTAVQVNRVLALLAFAFLALAVAFGTGVFDHRAGLPPIPPVDTNFISTATARVSAADLARSGGDTSDFECYTCHEKDKPPKLKFDAEGNVVVPTEHKNIVMAHGRHNRNNN